MISQIKHLLNRNDNLLRHTLLIFIASIVTGFVNYLYQLYMGRSLGPELYGILGVLFSIVYLEMFALGSINTVVSKLVSESKARNKLGEIKATFYFLGTRLLAIGIIFSMLVALFDGYISSYLKLPSPSMVYVLSFVILVTFIGPLFSGMQMFWWLAISSFFGAIVKLIFGALLVYLGFGVNGALVGLLLGTLVPIMLTIKPVWKIFLVPKVKIDSRKLFKYITIAMMIVTFTTFVINIDLILVKHKFNAFDAGIYASASTLAKIILFASGSLATVMLPKVSNGNGKSILRNTLLYVFLVGFGLSLVYFMFPKLVITLLFGKSYLAAAPIIGYLGISIAIYSVSNVLVVYNLAINRLGTIYFALFAIILEFVLINYFASTLVGVVHVVFFVNFLLFAVMVVYTKNYLVEKRDFKLIKGATDA